MIALAVAPKSNAVTTAIGAATADVRAGKIGPVPTHLRDAHYAGAKKIGHGSTYKYSHDEPFGIAEQQYAPDVVADAAYYQPTSLGAEAAIKERWERVRRLIRGDDADPAVRDGGRNHAAIGSVTMQDWIGPLVGPAGAGRRGARRRAGSARAPGRPPRSPLHGPRPPPCAARSTRSRSGVVPRRPAAAQRRRRSS